jgi:hypothetical protein
MERWIHMNHQIREREKATEMARNRELFLWVGAFYMITAGGLLSKYSRVKRAAVLTPLIPLTFVSIPWISQQNSKINKQSKKSLVNSR